MNVAGASPTPASMTQTERALASMTEKTRDTLSKPLLDGRIGEHTLAGALNDQIRFRVEGSGSLAERQIVPDSPLAESIMQSEAGPRLLSQLRNSLDLAGEKMASKTEVHGFMLHEGTESVLAGVALALLERDDIWGEKYRNLLKREGADGYLEEIRSERQGYKEGSLARAGAWNSNGWITFTPDTSRAMLVAAGAYEAKEGEEHLRRAGSWARYISGNGPHEVQHSVTFPEAGSYSTPQKWMEEGTANIFSRSPKIVNGTMHRTGVNPHSYAARLGHEPDWVPEGWGHWERPELPPAKEKENRKNADRNYRDSVPVLKELARLGGADFRSNAGWDRARELLQGKGLRYVPGQIARGIIEHQQLDPSVYEDLRVRIANAMDDERGVKGIIEDFNLER